MQKFIGFWVKLVCGQTDVIEIGCVLLQYYENQRLCVLQKMILDTNYLILHNISLL